MGVLSDEGGEGEKSGRLIDGRVSEEEVEKRLEEAKGVETDVDERVEAVKSLGKLVLLCLVV